MTARSYHRMPRVKIAANPAKVLAAISHGGETFALVDHQLKVSLFKAEQFEHIK